MGNHNRRIENPDSYDRDWRQSTAGRPDDGRWSRGGDDREEGTRAGYGDDRRGGDDYTRGAGSSERWQAGARGDDAWGRGQSYQDHSRGQGYQDYGREDYGRQGYPDYRRQRDDQLGRQGLASQDYGVDDRYGYGGERDTMRDNARGSGAPSNTTYRSGGYDRGGYDRGGYDQHSNQRAGMKQPGGFAGKGPKGYQRSDERLREHISESFMHHDELDASDIEVKVESGNVTLTGTVPSRHCKRLAEDLAEDCMGVKDVANQLRVQAAGDTSASREEPSAKTSAKRTSDGSGASGNGTARATS